MKCELYGVLILMRLWPVMSVLYFQPIAQKISTYTVTFSNPRSHNECFICLKGQETEVQGFITCHHRASGKTRVPPLSPFCYP